MPNGGMAFYNCGPESGASQPHKHVQLVPLPLEGAPQASGGGENSSGAAAADVGPPIWQAIAPALRGAQPWAVTELRSLPFAAFAVPLPQGPQAVTPALLADAFARLLARCRDFVARQQGQGPAAGVAAAGQQGPAEPAAGEGFSYNMLLTRRFLLLAPRRAEADGPVSCNSVAFAGSFFVRSREEVEYVKGRGPLRILAGVGLPWQ